MGLEVNWTTLKKKSRFCHHWEALALCTLLLSEDAFVTLLHHTELTLCNSSCAVPGAKQHPDISVHSSSSLVAAPQQDQGCIKELWVSLSAKGDSPQEWGGAPCSWSRGNFTSPSPVQANPGQTYHCISMKTIEYKKPIIIFAFLL